MPEYTYDHNLNVKKFLNTFDLKFSELCPHCSHSIHPELISWSGECFTLDELPNFINTILECPHCKKQYFEILQSTNYRSLDKPVYHSIKVYPVPTPIINLPSGVLTDYPKFHKIYLEAAIAENNNLFEICGMGYRKALEALVKQYAIELFPDEEETIHGELLLPTIKRLNSPKITTLATAAAWLGNDHAHLITKHPEYDLEQLKSFINALCQFIQSEKEFAKAFALTKK